MRRLPRPPPTPPRWVSVPGARPRARLFAIRGWRERVAEHTAWSFAAGLASGAGYALYTESIDFAPAIAAVAGNVTLVGCSFACAREVTRLVRQKDDWEFPDGAPSWGARAPRAWRGRPCSPAGAAVFGAAAGGAHFLLDPANTEWLCTQVGFKSVPKADGGVDWVTPAWFPVKRLGRELDANEIEFQMRVAAVLDGRVDAKEAERVRAEYARRRERDRARRAGKAGVP